MARCILLFLAVFLLALPGTARAQTGCGGQTYVVEAGDTLFSIGEKCGIPYMGLVGINYQLSSPDKLWPGQVIRLVAGADLGPPAPATGAPVEGGLQPNGIYLVRPGDSLARIAYLHRTTVAALLYQNPWIGPERILYTGQRVELPAGARMEKGWAGVNLLTPSRGERIVVRVQDFPPYANLEFRLSELDEAPVMTLAGTTDARGDAEMRMSIPLTARTGEAWVVEVATVAAIHPVIALTPIMIVE